VAAVVVGYPGTGRLTPYAARVHPAPVPVRRSPPVPAIAAAVLGLLSAGVAAVFALLALAFSGGNLPGTDWLLVAVPLLLAVVLVVGIGLLLTGRSWLALALPAGVLAALVGTGYVMGGLGAGAFGLLTVVVPLVTTVLCALPRVRSWVAARRAARTGG
jgi:hypothetical protein